MIIVESYLRAGDVIRFEFPYSAKSYGQKMKSHYAIVMEPSRSLLGQPFDGDDCLELTHYRAEKYGKAHPDSPYLDRDSFTKSYKDSDVIRNMFLDPANRPNADGEMPVNPPKNTYKYSVPHRYNDTVTIASIHPEANLRDYSYIGTLKKNIYAKFLDLVTKEYNRCNRMIIDRNSDVYELVRDKSSKGGGYIIDSKGDTVPRSAISESMRNPNQLTLMFITESQYRRIQDYLYEDL